MLSITENYIEKIQFPFLKLTFFLGGEGAGEGKGRTTLPCCVPRDNGRACADFLLFLWISNSACRDLILGTYGWGLSGESGETGLRTAYVIRKPHFLIKWTNKIMQLLLPNYSEMSLIGWGKTMFESFTFLD